MYTAPKLLRFGKALRVTRGGGANKVDIQDLQR